MDLPIELDELLRREDAGVEWKKGVADAADVVRKLTAFANKSGGLGDGGWVACGVEEELPPFLEQPCRDATIDDVNRFAAEEFFKAAKLPLPISKYLEPDVPIADQLRQRHPEAWRAGNLRLQEHQRISALDLPGEIGNHRLDPDVEELEEGPNATDSQAEGAE
jgi:hypothetical protein